MSGFPAGRVEAAVGGAAAVPVFDRESIGVATPPVGEWTLCRKTALTPMIRVVGAFEVETSEGRMRCEDGYLAVDSEGNPYPIAAEVAAASYESVGEAPSPASAAEVAALERPLAEMSPEEREAEQDRRRAAVEAARDARHELEAAVPQIGRIVIYRSRTGSYSVPAVVNAVEGTLNPEGVEAGHVPPLSSDRHVHLTVFTPGRPGMRGGAGDFLVESEHGRSENVAGCYQEWDVPFDNGRPGTVQEPGSWRWPVRS